MDTELLEQPAVKKQHLQTRNLILHNDDVNSFDFVIETLVDICHHNPLQAEQCAFIVHHKGKCAVKTGGYDALKPVCEALLNKGLTATID